ncbi:hypothetical protein PDESU_01734 [Pontiella desulfatans]|uniref:RapA2 cadherin-like domain-containing protein n=1 Tax=Pontiella desulfatans TaxID=2750659 RepID=A0A6C2TZQ3_PONDE|nr:Ig-like domain-containing protein [Pontiella desulfatans]VGO13180.1 hypothetical protein PDESU_01734 [Pontiella desulfatans]
MKKRYALTLCALTAGSVMAGTVQQNLGFDPDGTFIVKQDVATETSSAWCYTTNYLVLLGQSFSLTNETTLRAVTLVKAGDHTYSDGTNTLNLWIGEYSTNGVITSTNLLETFDLTGITLTNASRFSLNLDADIVLPVGDYAFQFWFDPGPENRLTVSYADDLYAGGTMLRAVNPATLPTGDAAWGDRDLSFGLHSEVVGVVTNVAPIADGQDVSTVPNVDLPITLTGMDPDGVTNLTYTVVDSPTNGALSGTAPDLTYEPDTDFEGLDQFTFTVFDGVYTSELATVTITVTNIPPSAAPQSVSTLQDVALDITLSGSDPEGSNLTYAVVDLPTNGMVSATDTNFLTYTPNSGYVGSDSFTFKVNDGVLDSELATVLIDVLPLGTEVVFSALSADTLSASNLLNVAGSTNGLAVSGVSASGDFVYSISYTDMDLDGDTLNDTLSFDVRVSAVNGTTTSFSTTPGASSANITFGSETVGDASDNPTYKNNPSGLAWITGTGSQGINPGDTLIYTVENISVTGTAGALDAAFLGFSGIVAAEYTSHSHQMILGSGSGLNGYQWNGDTQTVTDFSMNPLYVTAAVGGTIRWGVSTVDFTFSISSSAPPSSVGDVSYQILSGGTQIALSWPTEAGFNYGVQSRESLTTGTWSNSTTTVLGTGGEVIITNDITEDQMFYRSYLAE